MPEQLILPLQPPRVMVAETYINIPAIFARLNSETRIPGSYLIRGLAGSGKSHLLYALSHALGAQYCPLKTMLPAGAAALEGYEIPDVLCLDDLDFSHQSEAWVTTLQALITQRTEQGQLTVMSTCDLHEQLDPFALSVTESTTLVPLDIEQKIQAVIRRGAYRGIKLESLAAQWLVKQFGDDMHALMAAVKIVSKALPQRSNRITVKRLGMMKSDGVFESAINLLKTNK